MVPELAEGGAGQLRVPCTSVYTLALQCASGVHFPQQVPPKSQTNHSTRPFRSVLSVLLTRSHVATCNQNEIKLKI